MPRYYFEIANGHRLQDPSGLECTSAQDARAKADFMALHMAAKLDNCSQRSLIVVDEDGAEIYKVPLSQP